MIINFLIIIQDKMRKERYKYMQIGKTCGFYSIGCCLDELYGLDDPLGFISIMVENCKYSGLTVASSISI